MGTYLVKNDTETYYRHRDASIGCDYADSHHVGRDKAQVFTERERAEKVAAICKGLVVSNDEDEIVLSDYTARMIVGKCHDEE